MNQMRTRISRLERIGSEHVAQLDIAALILEARHKLHMEGIVDPCRHWETAQIQLEDSELGSKIIEARNRVIQFYRPPTPEED